MTAEQGIEGLRELVAALNERLTMLGRQAESVRRQWEGLKRAGGQRADHAASLLGSLRLDLRELARYAQECERQIAELEADPFGDKAA